MGFLFSFTAPFSNASPVLIPFLSRFFLSFYSVISRVFCPFWRFKFSCQHSVDVLCESFYMEMCFFDVFMGEGECDFLLLCHLALPPNIFFFFFLPCFLLPLFLLLFLIFFPSFSISKLFKGRILLSGSSNLKLWFIKK